MSNPHPPQFKQRQAFTSSFYKQTLFFLLTCLLYAQAQGEIPSDKTAPLYINSNQATLNKSTGISIFIGAVTVDKGSTHVACDKLTTYSNKAGKITKAIAESNPGHLSTYETLTDIGKPPLHAKAQTIEYYPERRYVILLHQAYVVQGPNSIKGEHLEYDISRQLLITHPGIDNEGTRTQIIIQPN